MKIGFIGLGIMGRPMALNLKNAGHDLIVPERKSLTDEEVANFREWKTTDVERFRRVIRKIIQFDLDLIENKADYVICHLGEGPTPGVSSGGTPAELTFAYRKGIPVYLVTAAPLERVSGWMLACADRVFGSVDELKAFLTERYGSQKQSRLWKE